jgi:hypothetical protein
MTQLKLNSEKNYLQFAFYLGNEHYTINTASAALTKNFVACLLILATCCNIAHTLATTLLYDRASYTLIENFAAKCSFGIISNYL